MTDSDYLKLYNKLFDTDFEKNDLWWIKIIIDDPKQLRESVKENKFKIDWWKISQYRLSEEFIREFKNNQNQSLFFDIELINLIFKFLYKVPSF